MAFLNLTYVSLVISCMVAILKRSDLPYQTSWLLTGRRNADNSRAMPVSFPIASQSLPSCLSLSLSLALVSTPHYLVACATDTWLLLWFYISTLISNAMISQTEKHHCRKPNCYCISKSNWTQTWLILACFTKWNQVQVQVEMKNKITCLKSLLFCFSIHIQLSFNSLLM